MHRNVEKFLRTVRDSGLDIEVREFPEGTRTAEDAARAVGVELGQIVKSLVFVVAGRPAMALVSGSNRLDEARLAEAAGGGPVERADADAVKQVTGYPVGGVPPFAHATNLATFIDRDLLAYDEVWAAAGHPHWCFPIAPDELVSASTGIVADLAA